jgi:hypothetical protein
MNEEGNVYVYKCNVKCTRGWICAGRKGGCEVGGGGGGKYKM